MFEYLKSRDISGKTAWLDMPSIVPGARLELRPASMSNTAYYNAALKLAARRSSGGLPKHVEAQDEINRSRDDDRVIFPGTVLVAWEGIVDDKGEPVEYNKEVAGDLLEALPAWMFDQVRAFAMDPENFFEAGAPVAPTAEEIQEKAGNSESDSSGS